MSGTYKDTITLFNRKRPMGVAADIWYPTVLTGVDLNTDRAAIAARYGYESTDKAILHIPWTDGGPESPVLVGGKPWDPPLLWRQEEDPAAALTFTPGEVFDFFVTGAWPDAGPESDADYARGFYDHLNRTRDGVFAITSVSIFSVIPHFEITGR